MSFTHPNYVGHFDRAAVSAGREVSTTRPLDEVVAQRLLSAVADRHVDGIYHVHLHRFVVGSDCARCMDWFPTSPAAAELIASLADTLACDVYDWDARKVYGSTDEFRAFARWAIARRERWRTRHPLHRASKPTRPRPTRY